MFYKIIPLALLIMLSGCDWFDNDKDKDVDVVTGTDIQICSDDCASPGACLWDDGVDCSAGPDDDGSVICNDGDRDSDFTYWCH